MNDLAIANLEALARWHNPPAGRELIGPWVTSGGQYGYGARINGTRFFDVAAATIPIAIQNLRTILVREGEEIS